MIILHGTWIPSDNGYNGNFFIWGENLLSNMVKRRGRMPKIPLHPFMANQFDLLKGIELLQTNNIIDISKKLSSDNISFLFPTISNIPQASNYILARNVPNKQIESIDLRPWVLNGFKIPLKEVFFFLFYLSETTDNNLNTHLGNDLIFWSQVSKYTLELLSKQRFIPNIIELDNHSKNRYAKWSSVITKDDNKNRISILIKSMPTVCIAFLQENKIIKSKKFLLQHYINSCINCNIQNWLNNSRINLKKTSLANYWLKSLLTGQSLQCSFTESDKLLKSITRWEDQIKEEEKASFRTCFRIEAPDENDGSLGHWILRYFLQAIDDPSLLVPTEKVWGEKKATLNFLNRKFNHPQEKLLKDLGSACRIFPPIEISLNSITPTEAKLSINEAYHFLKESAILFKESGFGVLIPPWWKDNGMKASLGLKLNLKFKQVPKTGMGILNFNNVIQYDWQVAIGDTPISKEDLEKLAELKVPLVQFRGEWIELKKSDIDKALNYFKKSHSGGLELSKALRLTFKVNERDQELPIMSYSATENLNKIFNQILGKTKIVMQNQPVKFEGKLRPYQKKGFAWLWFLRQYGLGACLADDMGLGKTIQLLVLLLKDREENGKATNLLVCPTSILGNWKRESNRFAPSFDVFIHHGTNRMDLKEFITNVKNYDLIITTYGLIHREEDKFSQIEWNSLILDEAQNIKNYYTKQSQAVRKLKANYRVALTGTPVENRLSELWSIMDFLNPGYLDSITNFHKKFSLPIERYNDITAKQHLKTIVQPFVLRRLKNDPTIIKDLPKKIESNVYCNLTREQVTLYKAVVDDILHKIDDETGIKRKGLVLSALTRLKQICNHPVHFLGDGSEVHRRSGKLNRLVEMLEEIVSEGHNALIFTQFAKMGAIIHKYLQETINAEIFYLHGGLSQKLRDKMILKFSEMNGPKIFVLSLKAGGVGLNLTQASHVFHFDRWWNPSVENQATDRAYRIGQTKNVIVYKFICEGTLEEKIDEMIENKKELAESIIGTGESWLTEMSTDQLKNIMTLQQKIDS